MVKTLYESSTFTQLGKTVGSALGPLSSPGDKPEYAREKDRNEMSESEEQMNHAIQSSGSTFFDALVQACSPHPPNMPTNSDISPKSTVEDEKKDELLPHGETLFERVINCTLIGGDEDDYSDEDTLKSRIYDYHSYGGSLTDPEGSYDSVTDDDESRRPRLRSRNSRR